MSSWDNDQFVMPNVMGMQPVLQTPMSQTMMQTPMTQSTIMPPLVPPMCMMNEWNHINANATPATAPSFIGPVIPENQDNVQVATEEMGNGQSHQNKGRTNRDKADRRERERDRSDRGRRRSRSYDRNRSERGDRSERIDRNDRGDRNERSDRNRSDRRDRRSKWDNNDKDSSGLGSRVMGNMMMPGNMMQYSTMLGQQQMDMVNMQTLTNMPNVQSMTNMPNIMPGMNMLHNMMDHNNLLLVNQQMMANQSTFVTNGVLLPPIPGASTPSRRERPPGCRTVFVGGLPNGISEDIISEIFQRFGTIDVVKLHRQAVCHVRFEKQESVEQSFLLSGYRFKYHDQTENEATTIFVDYALNREDQNEYEKNKRKREQTPPRVEPYSTTALVSISEKIKSDKEFAEAAPTLVGWLERGECNKKNSSSFYSLIQASNNQIRRLFNEKMQVDDEYQTMKNVIKEKFGHILLQFELVAKILSAAKHQRVSDHFTKQQRRNIEMWLKMTQEVDNIKEEFNANFEDDEVEKVGKNMIPMEKYEALKKESENLMYELEGYKNEAYLAKDEAERKFEKFKAHFIAQQALQHNQDYPPLPPPPMPNLAAEPPLPATNNAKPQPPPPTPDDNKVITTGPTVPPSEAKLISILTAFLMVHPLGASLDYLVSYIRSMVPNVTQATVHQILQKYSDVFYCKTSGVGATIEHRWCFVTFDFIKHEASLNKV